MVYNSTSAEQTEKLGSLLAEKLYTAPHYKAFIAMRGEMGVGKTAFVRGFASYFGISGIKSPTYTVVNEHHGKVSIFHFDMYRIESEDDLYSIGFDDYTDREGYCIAEWSENVSEFLPENRITVTIERAEPFPDGRKIDISLEGTYEDIGI